jgi:hypothetical protein
VRPYRVSLHEDKGDKHQLVFWCWADDEEHAEEQALNAYPNGEVLHVTLGECPLDGDPTDRCADCIYAGDYEFYAGECRSRDTGMFAGVGRELDEDEQEAFDATFPPERNDEQL